MKTTPEHFAVFEAAVRKWVDRFGLRDWDIDVKRGRCGGDEFAICERGEQHAGDITLSTRWGKPVTDELLERCAIHEVCHLVLADFAKAAEARFVREGEIDEQEHTVIYRLENVLMEAGK